MKPRKNSAKKVSQHKILGSQAEKLKDKLQTLKEQIRLKKQEKIMNKTATTNNPFKNNFNQKNIHQSRMSSTQYNRKQDNSLLQVLSELKIQNVREKLNEKSIYKKQQLLTIRQEDLDKWKEIPIGYRIKLKKYIEQNKTKQKVSQLKIIENKPQNQTNNSNFIDIEQIIKNRKSEQLYIPLNRQSQQIQESQHESQLEEQDQQKMMMSILQVLGKKQKKSIFKKDKVKSQKAKKVCWSPQVDQMQKQHPIIKVYPKQKIVKTLFHQNQKAVLNINNDQQPQGQKQTIKKKSLNTNQNQLPDYKYCWICLKKIQIVHFIQAQRYFCNLNCQQKYQQQVNKPDLFKSIIETQQKYNKIQQQHKAVPNQGQIQVDFDIL